MKEKMNAEERRNKVRQLLSNLETPISASKLASELGVTRQVIVNDVALLRAAGCEISSFANGYLMEKPHAYSRVFKVQHTDEDVETELNLIVDAGGVAEDVFVYHKVYGKVRAEIGIKSRLQVKKFLGEIQNGKSSLLKNVTAGYHYHTISADTPETLDLIEEALRAKGFLAPLQEYEPMEMESQ